MGRSVIYALMLVVVIELSLYLFAGSDYDNTTLFALILDPTNILANPVYILAIAAIALFAVSPIIPGIGFSFNQSIIYSSMATAFFTFTLTITNLWAYINGQLTDLGSKSPAVIASIIVLPLLLFFIIAVFDWIRGTD